MSPCILVVDDEPQVREVIQLYLSREGMSVQTVCDGMAALTAFDAHAPDLIILDLMLPQLSGLEVFRRIRNKAATPVIMLTAKSDELDRVLGLELGADDYVVKPFSPRELVARVKNILRRAVRTDDPAAGKPLVRGDLQIDPRSRAVRVKARPVELTGKEFDLLYFMALHPAQVFSRAQLLERVWGYEFFGDASTVTVHIRRLREKIEANAAEPQYLTTVWGVGYKFEKSD
jgi:DNA-binding response OmpR family regulator